MRQQHRFRVENRPQDQVPPSRPEDTDLSTVGEGHPSNAQTRGQMIEVEGVYIISVAARILDMHPQTLRKYEKLGLINPGRTIGMLRLYSIEDIKKVRLIRYLSDELGLSRDRVTLRLKGLAFEAIFQGECPPNYEDCCRKILRDHVPSRHAQQKLEKKLRGYWDTLVKTCQDCPSPHETIASIIKQNENMPTRKHYLRDLEPFITRHYSSLIS